MLKFHNWTFPPSSSRTELKLATLKVRKFGLTKVNKIDVLELRILSYLHNHLVLNIWFQMTILSFLIFETFMSQINTNNILFIFFVSRVVPVP